MTPGNNSDDMVKEVLIFLAIVATIIAFS